MNETCIIIIPLNSFEMYDWKVQLLASKHEDSVILIGAEKNDNGKRFLSFLFSGE